MTYTAPHHKVTVYGDAYNGAEFWSFGWRMTTADTSSANAAATAVEIKQPILNFWNRSGATGFFATHRLQGVKVAAIGVDGKYPANHEPGEWIFGNVAGPNPWDSARGVLPQESICVTLLTNKPKGLGSKGRFFLPPCSVQVQADGLIPGVHRDALNTAVKTMLDAINSSTTLPNTRVAIFSQGKGVKVENEAKKRYEWDYSNSTGVTNDVTSVAIGRVIDTQRRRRRSLVESRSGIALAS